MGSSPIRPFNDYARDFDPNMPQEQYDAVRKHYFDNFVAPRVDKKHDVEATRKAFYAKTERQGMMSPLEKVQTNIKAAEEGWAQEIARPIQFVSRKLGTEQLTNLAFGTPDEHRLREQDAANKLRRNGTPNLGGTLGHLAGMGDVMAFTDEGLGLDAAAARAAGALQKTGIRFLSSPRGLELSESMLRGALSFSTYNALEATNAHRNVAAARGFGEGLLWGAGGDLVGRVMKFAISKGVELTRGAAIEQIQKVMTGEKLTPEMEDVVTSALQKNSEVAAREPRPMNIIVDEKAGAPKVFTDNGKGVQDSFNLTEDNLEKVKARVESVLANGGSVTNLLHSSEDLPLVQKFMQIMNESHAPKYEGATPITVNPGEEIATAKQIKEQTGIDAQVAGKGKVVIPPFAASKPTQAEAIRMIESDSERSLEEASTLKRAFNTVWDPAATNTQKLQAVERLREAKLPELLPSPKVVAAWGKPFVTSDTAFPNSRFEDWLSSTELDGEKLTLGQRRYVENTLKTLWDKSIPDNAAMKQNALKILREYKLPADFMPGKMKAAEEMLQKQLEGEAAWNALTPEEQLMRKISDTETRLRGIESTSSEKALEAELAGYKQALEEVRAKSLAEQSQEAEDEIQQVMREEIEQKSRNVDVAKSSQLEEAKRLGQLPSAQAGGESLPAHVPPGERRVVITRGGAATRVMISKEFMDSVLPGARGFATSPKVAREWLKIPEEINLGLDPVMVVAKEQGKSLLQTSRDTVWHEALHAHIMNITNFSSTGAMLAAGKNSLGWKTATEIATKLGQDFKIYNNMTRGQLVEEAFVWSATAIRTGDAELLRRMAAYDTDVDHVYNFVENTADALRDRAISTMEPGPARNLAVDRLDFIRRMTNTDKADALRLMTEQAYGGGDVYFGPEGTQFVVRNGRDTLHFNTESDMIDHLEKMATQSPMFAPDFTAPLEYAGVKTPIAPSGLGPSKDLPMPESSPEGGWKFSGTQTIRSLYEPTSKWFSDLDSKINSALSAKGQRIPIFDRFKAVDIAFRDGETWLDANRQTASEFLKGGADKLKSYFEVLKTNPRYWDTMQKKLNLSAADMQNIQKANSWMEKFRDDTQIPVFNYLREDLDKLRRFNFNSRDVWKTNPERDSAMSFFHRSVVNGDLNPKDNHLGRFVDFLLRSGMEKKYTGAPLKELEKLVNAKDEAGHYILGAMRLPVGNYVNYMRGIPDVTGQVIRKTISQLQESVAAKFAEMNKYLPAGIKLPTEFNYPGSVLNKMLMFSYAANIGGRVAIPIRDALQVFSTALPVIGPSKFVKGLNGLSKGGFQFAFENGALLTKTNVGELYGDMFGELPPHSGGIMDKAVKLSNYMMAPSRWGHNVARAVVFNSTYEEAASAVQKFRAGQMDWKQVLDDTGLWFADKPRQDQLLQHALDKTFDAHEFAKQSALEVVDLTLWAYRRGAQPLALRTGVGRIFGQYGLWPLNYLSYMKRLAGKIGENPKMALSTAAMWAGVNYAAVETFKEVVGADVSKWFWFSPMGYGGSAHFQAAQDLFRFPEETNEGRAARHRLMEYPGQFVPSFTELKSVMESITDDAPMFDDSGRPTDNFLKVMGFKAEKEEPDRDIEQTLRYELGEGARR